MPTISSFAARQLSDGSFSGVVMGQSAADPIAFYGGTPKAQPAGATSNVPATASTLTLSAVQTGSTAGVGFSTNALFNAFVSTIVFLQTDILAVQVNLNALHQAMSSLAFTKGS